MDKKDERKRFFRFGPHHRRGDTIVEVLIAIVLLSVILTTAYVFASRSLSKSTENSKRNTALSIAQSQVSQLSNAQGSLSSGLEKYRLDTPFCINSHDGSTTAATQTGDNGVQTCPPDANGYSTGVSYDNSTATFTITTQWGRKSSNGANQVQLFYRAGQYYASNNTGSGSTGSRVRPGCTKDCGSSWKSRHHGNSCGCACYDSNPCAPPPSGTDNGGGDTGNPSGGGGGACPGGGSPAPDGSCGEGSCFNGDSLVDMADGTRKRIDQVRSGDWVVSYDFAKKQKFNTQVNDIVHTQVHAVLKIKTFEGDINTSFHQRFWTGNEWLESMYLYPGVVTGSFEGQPRTVLFRNIQYSQEAIDQYDLHLMDSNHSYYVNGFLVHNNDHAFS